MIRRILTSETAIAAVRSATHVFPTKTFTALAAIDITDGVVSGCHLSVDRLTLDDIDAKG